MTVLNQLIHEPTGERMVPESADYYTFWEHIYRYAFACHFVKGMRVLDIACGEGYGSAALRRAGAAHITGVDVSEEVCVHARDKYGICTKPGSAERIPLEAGSVDVVVSFETIEHVERPDCFLDECVRVLTPGGRLIISTPNKRVYGRDVKNPYHCSEMTEEEFTVALHSRFRGCQLYTQRPMVATWWNPRTLACEDTPWKRLRGFCRFRDFVQKVRAHETFGASMREQRAAVLDAILSVSKHSHTLFNPFSVRPRRSWGGEAPIYFIATAFR